MLSNRRFVINARECLNEVVIIVPIVFYGAEAWGMRSAEMESERS